MSASDLSPHPALGLTPSTESSASTPASGPTWQEQDGLLRDLWLKNQTPQEISSALGRSVPAIMTRAARLGLPRRSAPGRKPGRRTMDDGGGMMAATYVRHQSQRQSTEAYQDSAPQTSLRVCLMCLNKFESYGRHNRICSSCKNSSEYESASSLPEINLPTA